MSTNREASETNDENRILDAHERLAHYNAKRLLPSTPQSHWREDLHSEIEMLTLEGEVLELEREQISKIAAQAPQSPKEFINWFVELKNVGPGQNDPLFDWLSESASIEQMRWFIRQEVAGEAGFDDLAALTQLKMPTRPKLEIARNYWDEMGRGNEKGMHGPMLTKVAQEIGLSDSPIEQTVPEALALGNVLLGLALNRRYAYHSIGALGAVELTAPGRSKKVYEGLKRLGMSAEGQRYYLLHSTLDVKHSATWNEEVILPLIEENPQLCHAIAEGALMRLNAGARCFERYRQELWK